MAHKTGAQRASIKSAGLKPLRWRVLQDQSDHIIILHRLTGEVKVFKKGR